MQEFNQDEKDKSEAIRNQFAIHESLISMRLTKLEQVLLSANQLPSNFEGNESFSKITNSSQSARVETKDKIHRIIGKLMGLEIEEHDESLWSQIKDFDSELQKDCN